MSKTVISCRFHYHMFDMEKQGKHFDKFRQKSRRMVRQNSARFDKEAKERMRGASAAPQSKSKGSLATDHVRFLQQMRVDSWGNGAKSMKDVVKWHKNASSELNDMENRICISIKWMKKTHQPLPSLWVNCKKRFDFPYRWKKSLDS